MSGFVLRRLSLTVVMLFTISILVFVGCEILPGDVAQVSLGQFATEDTVLAPRVELGDWPPYERYLRWLGGILQGDWGRSITTKTSVTSMLSERVWNTAILAGATTLIAIPLALGLGLLMAVGAGGMWDRAASVTVIALSATPEFLIGTLAVLLFAVHLRWLPAVAYLSSGADMGQTVRALMLPVSTLVIVVVAQIARMTRAIIGNLLTQPFIEMARLKGVPARRVVGSMRS